MKDLNKKDIEKVEKLKHQWDESKNDLGEEIKKFVIAESKFNTTKVDNLYNNDINNNPQINLNFDFTVLIQACQKLRYLIIQITEFHLF